MLCVQTYGLLFVFQTVSLDLSVVHSTFVELPALVLEQKDFDQYYPRFPVREHPREIVNVTHSMCELVSARDIFL